MHSTVQSKQQAILPVVLLVMFLSGACTQRPAGTEPLRLLGTDPLTAVSVTGYHEVLVTWMQRGLRNMTAVHAGPKDGLAFVPPARVKTIKDLLQNGGSGTDVGDLVTADNYLFLAQRLGLIRRVFWVIPYHHVDYINAELRVQAFLRNETSHFSPQDVGSMRFRNGCVSGTLAGIEVHVCSPTTLPRLAEPAVVTIDPGFFPLYAANRGPSGLGATKEFFDLMAIKRIGTRAVSVAASPEFQGMRGYLSEEIVSILKDPEILQSTQPPDLWALREQADGMLTRGDVKEAAGHLEKHGAAFPADPYLHLMRWTAQALLSKRASALNALTALCVKDPVLCSGIVDAGVLLREQGDLAGAEEFLRKAVSLQQLRPGRARREYAVTLYQAGKYADAQREASPLVADPAYTVAGGLLLGDCAYALQQNDEAVRRYEGALSSYREAGGYRLSKREQESISRLKSLYQRRNDKRGLRTLEGTPAFE